MDEVSRKHFSGHYAVAAVRPRDYRARAHTTTHLPGLFLLDLFSCVDFFFPTRTDRHRDDAVWFPLASRYGGASVFPTRLVRSLLVSISGHP